MAKFKKLKKRKITLGDFSNQFRGVNWNDLPSLPILPKLMFLLSLIVLVIFLAYLLIFKNMNEELASSVNREGSLKKEYIEKYSKAVSLDIRKRQIEQVRLYVEQTEKQLPTKSEMADLLSDINLAGLGRGLRFELFKPEKEVFHDYYVELPISIRVTGAYQEIGTFVADVAALSRIVTVGDMEISPIRLNGTNAGNIDAVSDVLVMKATVRTYRYLDPEELNQRKLEKEKKKR